MSKKDDVAGIPAKIARAIEQAEIVHMENPDDLTEEGVVVGYAKPMTHAERAATLAGATEGILESARHGEKGERFIDFFGDDVITAQVRAEMMTLCVDLLADIPPDEAEVIRNSIVQRERIENLKEWLDKGGWQKAEADRESISRELERCFRGVPEDIVAREYPPQPGDRGRVVVHRLVRLAGKKSAPIQGRPSVSVTGAPLEYLDALRFCFDAKEWAMLLRTAEPALREVQDRDWATILRTADPELREKIASDLDQEIAEENKAGEGVFDQFAWLRLLVRPYVEEEVARVVEIEQHKKRAQPLSKRRSVVVQEHEFGKVHKVAAGISWAFGGTGVRFKDINLDGHQFAPTPDVAVAKDRMTLPDNAIVPPSLSLIPAEFFKHPHQTTFPLDLSPTDGDPSIDEVSPPLAVEIANATRYALTLQEAKLALYIMADALVSRGNAESDFKTTSARELGRILNPGASLRTTHYQTIFKSLSTLKTLRVCLPNGYAYEVFHAPSRMRDISTNEFDEELYVGLMPAFRKILSNVAPHLGPRYGGDVLIDLTGIMGLRKAGALRQYIRLCGYWNFWRINNGGSMDRMPTISMERWASLTNHLSLTAVEAKRSKNPKKSGAVRMSEAVTEVLEGVDELADDEIVKVVKANRKEICIVPTERHIEAYRLHRQGMARIGGNVPE
jgi:hypothetical protein